MDLESQLLKSSLVCDLKSEGKPIHRIQLFFVANKELNSKSHQDDFQRALETGVLLKKYWENWPEKMVGKKGSGEYRFTKKGYDLAKLRFPQIEPKYSPKTKEGCHFSLKGKIGQTNVFLRTRSGKTEVFLDGQVCKPAKLACQQMEKVTGKSILTKNGNAIKDLYNLAIDYDFEMQWDS